MLLIEEHYWILSRVRSSATLHAHNDIGVSKSVIFCNKNERNLQDARDPLAVVARKTLE